ncbi:peptidylprolyl isomerase [Sulfurimonas sp.]|uniref:peptidylprolyl isomerase n=1 Tax=Sulfurimonas sp. TaxID=2022749 RepID=UPI00356B5575
MAYAEARHILVPTEEECNALKAEIEAGADFADIAAQKSECPSGRNGGALGRFSPGQMVPEFDEAVFRGGDVGELQGPIQTQFGFHLLEVTARG